MPDVAMSELEKVFERKMQEIDADPEKAFRAACRELGITNHTVITSMHDAFIGRRKSVIIGRWESRRPLDRHELQLPKGDR